MLQVNTDKTKVIIFSRGKVRKIPIFRCDNNVVEVVDEYVYLGTTFNYDNSFRKAQIKQLNQARRAMYSLFSKTYHFNLPIDILLELFDQRVLPMEAKWGFGILKELISDSK